jgi:type I restriction enzyme M protein
MSDTSKFNPIVSFLWSIADLLNGAFKKSEFQKIVLPFTVLRRLDYALEATKAKVLETEHELKEKGLENRHGQLCRASGYAFYNTSKFTYENLLHDDANLALNLRQYVMGFSPNVRDIFAAFNFDDAIRDLDKVNLLFFLMERFNEKSDDIRYSLSPKEAAAQPAPERGRILGRDRYGAVLELEAAHGIMQILEA